MLYVALCCSLRGAGDCPARPQRLEEAAGLVPLGRRREGMLVCLWVCSREVEMSGRIAEMLRALWVSLALSTMHARGPSIYGDRQALGGQ